MHPSPPNPHHPREVRQVGHECGHCAELRVGWHPLFPGRARCAHRRGPLNLPLVLRVALLPSVGAHRAGETGGWLQNRWRVGVQLAHVLCRCPPSTTADAPCCPPALKRRRPTSAEQTPAPIHPEVQPTRASHEARPDRVRPVVASAGACRRAVDATSPATTSPGHIASHPIPTHIEASLLSAHPLLAPPAD